MWSGKDCDELYNWPLAGWLFSILCDLSYNILNYSANDDFVGSCNLSLTTNLQEFSGYGLRIKMKLQWYELSGN